MSENRPFVLSIAGFDPSGGAGVLADCKTFEQHQVVGLAVLTANTIQTAERFFAIQWTPLDFVLESISKLLQTHPVAVAKIGIVPSLAYLSEVVATIKRLSPNTKIVWDTVLKSSTNFDFLTIENQAQLLTIIEQIDLITPNYTEIMQLMPPLATAEIMAQKLSEHVAVLLKGGHHPETLGVDQLFTNDTVFRLDPQNTLGYEKHGSGCVLSAAITANLAKKQRMVMACKNAKTYIENYLSSNTTKLGYHHV
ncbi:hydroxymethylpyrimidine/phosphomethylpyrimidine kinase [Flavobacterium crassostreae]|uniref:hydroxymethylpyrimidine kinase n=1 Tax=Flavobacterium crassostreae TaxID=1763534 RepID=A0A1B9E4N1_9FLAO|nr:hydroxymethylpyrimidine/phosphomethylpyrimidine kinase [Flavobacterium crassostreae]OCB76895.1 hydroxymethylpyrimidine/phosphomethylpyrimidine kinase [Flavobacterium crassostreae]